MATKKTIEHSKRYKDLKDRYERNGCTKEQLRRFTGYGVLTEEEYEEITDEAYNQG